MISLNSICYQIQNQFQYIKLSMHAYGYQSWCLVANGYQYSGKTKGGKQVVILY